MSRFYWLRDRRSGAVTVGHMRDGYWAILNGLSGWWMRHEVEEEYEIGPEIEPPLPWRPT